MSTRTSFELHPGGCRVVEVYPRPDGRAQDKTASSKADVRVRAFVPNVPGSGADLTATLAGLRKERKLASEACVTVWGLRSAYQFLRLPPAKDEDLEALATREARKEIAPLEVDGFGACVALIVGADAQVGSHRRREVSLVAVSEADVRKAIQPITDAGFVVGRVLTPAVALTAVARGCADVVPGSTLAYVAIGANATCVAIVRDGVLLFAREIQWGHAEDGLEPIETRLGSELRRSILYFRQTFRTSVDGVVLCGDAPHLRALTAPVSAALSIPVQTLDSLNGIDGDHVPEPADIFRTHVASLRIAIAAAAEATREMNLLPASIRQSRDARSEMMRVIAAVAAGLLIVAAWYGIARSSSAGSSEVADLEQRIAVLEPQSIGLAQMRRASTSASLRRAALTAFDSQGPRLSRLLELLSRNAPDEIALTSIDVQAEGGSWRTTVQGLAVSRDVAAGQGAVNRLLDSLSASPLIGPVVQPPSFRLIAGQPAEHAATAALIPEGMSGVEFVMQFKVPR